MPGHKRKTVGRPVRPDAAFRVLAERFRKQVTSGAWAPGSALPPRRQLARRYRAGEQTVRMALDLLRSEGWIGKSTRNRWLVVGEAGQRPLVDQPIIIVVGSNLETWMELPEHASLLRGMEKEAGVTGAPVLIIHNRAYREHLPANLDRLTPRGILLVGEFKKQAMSRYQVLRTPVVLVNRPGLAWNVHAIRGDNIRGSQDATRHLIGLGHRRIAFARLLHLELREIDAHSRQRLTGFRNAFREANLSLDSEWIFNTTVYDRPDSPSIQAIMRAIPPFTAVVAADVSRAQLVEEAAKVRGIRVPEDLSIVCFQGRRPADPRFTGPRADHEDLGRKAVRLLEAPRKPRRRDVVPMVWTDGITVAPRPGRRPQVPAKG